MEYENPTKGKCLNSDIITTLPQNIIENILSLIPLQDAVRTSILSKKWRYSWRSMPKLGFTNKLVELPSNSGCTQLKCKLASAIFSVLLLHDGPEILEFNCHLHTKSEFVQIMSYLARWNKLKELIFCNDNRSYKLPVSFFSLLGLERIDLQNCTFEPPLTCNAFTRLKSTTFINVEASARMLKRFLSKCPLLESLYLVSILYEVPLVYI
ncbi:F-box/FBD/LRR-repeat protein At1g13570-like [Bidens hawaiensis]|uniref:F-box/FBD/LRR-repeat protein At1g13570-like n=1 Tax=Bidens hawaiensis TaxID=980011 RepID=UPI00404B0F0A